jgi:hypothetical protein
LAEGFETFAGFCHESEQAAGANQKSGAGRGQGNALVGTSKELDSELSFQNVDLARQRRLGDAEARRGPIQAQGFGDRHEVSQMFQFHFSQSEYQPNWRNEQYLLRTFGNSV